MPARPSARRITRMRRADRFVALPVFRYTGGYGGMWGMAERLIVVSNRLPLTLKRAGGGWRTERSAGGLATAVNPLRNRTEGIWIGAAGPGAAAGDPAREAVLKEWAERDRCFVVDLPPDIDKLYYEGFSNQTLWPLFHSFPSKVRFAPEAWGAYVEANRRFCDLVLQHYRDGDLIWVHDYHLMMLPEMLRQARPKAAIGWFLHIPFPSSEIFRILPRREQVLEGLLGADLLAFHTHSHLQHFRKSLRRVLGIEADLDRVEAGKRAVRLEAMPIGIAPGNFLKTLATKPAEKYRAELCERYRGSKMLLAVDRLDYTKGIPERLCAYARLLERYPERRGKTVLVQLAVPSREGIGAYAGLQRRVHELISEINGKYGTPDWTPVVYIRRGVPAMHLAAMYSVADIGWVNSLRDGMNLVAKEYVACKPEGGGALMVSEFTGAAEDLGEAFIINPYDEVSVAETIDRVLSASPEELRERMRVLHERVVRNNVFAWGERFLESLREAARARAAAPAEEAPVLQAAEVKDAYRRARRRALFIDYDGTLVGFAARPEQAAPPPEVLDVLRRLAAVQGNTVVVVSGRRARDLDGWFGEIPGLWLAAEHGAIVRRPEQRWEALRHPAAEWKERIRAIFNHYIDRTPGSLIEEKQYSLAWHYRMAEPEFGEWLANELAATLEGLLADTDLRATRGAKVVEVRPIWANKGQAVAHILEAAGRPEFRLILGDDRTDEDMFIADPEAWSARVRGGATKARYTLPDVDAVRSLLNELAGVNTALAA